MKNDEKIKTQKKLLYKRYKVAVLLILLFIFCILSYEFCIHDEFEIDVDSDYAIRVQVAKQLNKNVNDLTAKDFKNITKLSLTDINEEGYYLSGLELTNIKLLRKFKNLRELDLSNISVIQGKLPKWKKILIELCIIKLPEVPLLDIHPLRR